MEALLADGHQLHILAPIDDSVGELAALGCSFTHLQMDRKGLNPLAELALRRRMGRHFDAIQPDMILGFTIKNNVFGAMAAAKRAIPFVPNVTGLGTAFQSGGMLQSATIALYRNAFRACPLVFFQNSNDRDRFCRHKIVAAQRTQLLPGSGIDLEAFRPAAAHDRSEKLTFIMIARLLRDKGVFEYAEAARTLHATMPQARFQLVGEAGSANRTAISLDRARELEKTHNISYLGTSDDVPALIEEADCVVLPSYYPEGAPRSLIEAAAMARPIITTDMPGCRDIVRDGKTGYLCVPRNVSSLVTAIGRFASLTFDEREQMGASGRMRMQEKFDVAFVIRSYREAIAQFGSKVHQS